MKLVMQENCALKKKLDKQHRATETDHAKQLRLTNKRQAFRSKMSVLNNQKETNGEENDSATSFLTKNSSNMTQDISKTMYLNEFDMLKNGPLRDQSWAKCNMKQFHKSIKFVICQCIVCKEAWPINTKPKSAASYMCLRCSRDKSKAKNVFRCQCHYSWTQYLLNYKVSLKQRKCSLLDPCQL